MLHKMFQYRIYPTKKQQTILECQIEECCWLYNHLLEKRRDTYEQTSKGLSCYEQQATYPMLKQERPSLKDVHSQVLQNVAVRIDLAFQAFLRRCKFGENPGYPRFKGKGRYNSLTFPQVPSGCQIKDGKLVVSKVGKIKLVLHRGLTGTPKTCTISKSATGKWYCCFSCEVETERLLENAESVGIDIGLKTFATLSSGEEVENPRFFHTEEQALAKVQRKHSKLAKGTLERRKDRKAVAREGIYICMRNWKKSSPCTFRIKTCCRRR